VEWPTQPSGVRNTVLAAPIRAAEGASREHASAARSLKGDVTLNAARPLPQSVLQPSGSSGASGYAT
jgi:hypothetical protein